MSAGAAESRGFTRRVLTGGVGLVYLSAFLSLWVQVDGLIGPRGILPLGRHLELASARGVSFFELPTLSRFLGTGTGALYFLCALGTLCGLLLISGLIPFPAALGAWACYLSLYHDGQRFLSFQWDALLLETGFLALFLNPPAARHVPRDEPPPIVWWLYRILLFKFMLSSGVVKFTSGDPTWRDLTALAHHYETTCLPTWTGWYVHHLPLWFHKASALLTFAVELTVPFFIFGGRALRLAAAGSFIALMTIIGATGNYGFFNLQTIVLCVALLDDAVFPRRLRERFWGNPCDHEADAPRTAGRGVEKDASSQTGSDVEAKARTHRHRPTPVLATLAALLVVCHTVALTQAFRRIPGWMAPALRLYEKQAPFHLASHYGLFASMTTRRPEIVLEGSDDRRHWRPYEFKYKAGDPAKRPEFIGLHMPRLDWLLWFAALGDARREWWIQFLSLRLLQGSKPVLGLLEENPFPDAPPRYLRARLYDYRFAGPAERAATGSWWKREELGAYLPILYIPPGDPDTLAVWRESSGPL